MHGKKPVEVYIGVLTKRSPWTLVEEEVEPTSRKYINKINHIQHKKKICNFYFRILLVENKFEFIIFSMRFII